MMIIDTDICGGWYQNNLSALESQDTRQLGEFRFVAIDQSNANAVDFLDCKSLFDVLQKV